MKRIFLAFFCLSFIANSFSQTILFDAGWRFHRGGAQSAEMAAFDDSKWKSVDLPHDWSIEDLPGTQSPFDSNVARVGIAKLLLLLQNKKINASSSSLMVFI